MVSIACTAHCNNIPSYSCNVPPYILTRPDEDKLNQSLEFPAIEHLDPIINNCSESVTSRMSDLSVSESVFCYRDSFMMKDNKYDDSNENIRTLTNTSPIVSEEEIMKMNLHWKNSTMISFSTWGKKVLHGFCILAFVGTYNSK